MSSSECQLNEAGKQLTSLHANMADKKKEKMATETALPGKKQELAKSEAELQVIYIYIYYKVR